MPKTKVKNISVSIDMEVTCNCGTKFLFEGTTDINYASCPTCTQEILIDVTDPVIEVLNVEEVEDIV